MSIRRRHKILKLLADIFGVFMNRCWPSYYTDSLFNTLVHPIPTIRHCLNMLNQAPLIIVATIGLKLACLSLHLQLCAPFPSLGIVLLLYDLVDDTLRSSLSQVPFLPLPWLFLLRIPPVSFDRFYPISHNMIPDYREFSFNATYFAQIHRCSSTRPRFRELWHVSRDCCPSRSGWSMVASKAQGPSACRWLAPSSTRC